MAMKKAGTGTGNAIGNETKADMRGAGIMGGESSLGGAVAHLRSEHPIAYDDHGPHHGGTEHIRHEPLGGLRPCKG